MAPKKSQKQKHPSSASSSTPWSRYGIQLASDNEKKWFRIADRLDIHSTKFVCHETTLELGIRGDVELLMSRLGWCDGQDHGIKAGVPTYRRLVLEFLATVQVIQADSSQLKLVNFRLFNQEFHKTFRELNLIWGFDPESPLQKDEDSEMESDDESEEEEVPEGFDGFSDQDVWLRLTGRTPYDRRKEKTSRLIHPAVRYVQKLWMFAIYGRNEMGNVHPNDAKLFFLILNEKRTPVPINFAEQLINRIISERSERCKARKERSTQEKFLTGGMITILAKHLFGDHFDQNLEGEEPLKDGFLLDMPSLIHFRIISEKKKIIYKVFDHPYCYLPDFQHVSLFRQVQNPFLIERTPAPSIAERAQQLVGGSVAAPPPRSRRPEAGSSSASSETFDLSQLQQQINFIQSEVVANSYYSRALFSLEVERGNIPPPVNWPFHPPQAGPVPGWNNEQPTYPYWPYRANDELGYDYRQPRGSNPRYDPNTPPFYGGVPPPGYHERVDLMDSFQGNLPPGFSMDDDVPHNDDNE